MSARTVVLAGGGTAGHVNPLLALAEQIRSRHPGTELRVLGTAEGLEADLVPAAGLELTVIERVPLPRRPSADWFRFPGRWRRALAVATECLRGADVLVGFGGYVAAPAYIAARRLGVPIVVHEQNARPGLANRLGARYAARTGVSFPRTPLRGGELVGLPLRAAITDLLDRRNTDRRRARQEGAAALGLDADLPTIVVTGGSLGAQRLNQVVPELAGELTGSGVQVLHLTGRGKDVPVREHLATVAPGDGTARYRVQEYLMQMEQALACADLVIARSGAGTVSEISALGIPAVYVPLPIGNGEQARNAAPVVQAGGALIVDDREFDSDWLRRQVLPLITDEAALAQMRRAAAGAGITDGAERLAALTFDAIGSQ
ncbi:MAG TPA: undecaprenyldiphospho-muramoylpentapeptide beta-N-acetylglucosaminyltransferase [Beutenbergiaceae bacterium]|nr:undecaprenyldiphospho-muramoylpentapeptide beta-N-acetylglucosaminyltransferase [Beutenbergiaceae bacterium]